MTTLTGDIVGTCFICRRRHDNVGVAGHQRATVKWMCWPCLEAKINLKKAYHMPQRQLDDYERRALEDSGNAGGEYLDSLGRTDLAQLEPEEYQHYLKVVLTTFAESMREIVSREVPF